MLVPFSVADFIDRAVQVYGERTGVVDEPDQPAPSLGELTYAQVGDLARRQAAHLDSSASASVTGWRWSATTAPGCSRRSSASPASAGCWCR